MNTHVKEIMKALDVEDFICPACLLQLTPPVMMCGNGHNTYSECKTFNYAQQCPICEAPYVETPNRVFDKMLSLLSKSPACPYIGQGCPSLVSDGHESQFCTFRTIPCPKTTFCKWEGKVKDWVGHVVDQHFNGGLVLVNEPLEFDTNSFRLYFRSGCLLMVDESYYFFYLTDRNQGDPLFCDEYNLTVKHVPTKNRNDQHFFRIVFRVKNGNKKGATSNSFVLKPFAAFDNDHGNCDGLSVSFRQLMFLNYPGDSVIITAIPIF